MKWLALVVVTAACSESGAHFTISAPNGPTGASSFEVVLAAPDQISSIENQRVTPGSNESQTVPYFLQQTVAGASNDSIDMVDGLRIKIEPGPTLTQATYIPFVMLKDDAGAIVGIGTYHAAGAALPSPVIVKPDEIDKYTIDVEPVTLVDDMTHAAPGQVMVVNCSDEQQNTFASGIVWRPLGGGELRLMFPIDGSLDATSRDLDLDCDAHPVAVGSSDPDCDDTRAWFHAGAREMCDGFDTNCDGSKRSVVACPATGTVCTSPSTPNGIALCDDTTGQTGTCTSDPACVCALGSTTCARCAMTWQQGTTAGNVIPCQPGQGSLAAGPDCTANEPCTVEVIAVHGGWKVEVASSANGGSFGDKTTGVAGRFGVRIKRPEGPGFEMPGAPGTALGQAAFVITPKNGAARLFAIQIGVEGDVPQGCQGTGPFPMSCTP